MALDKRQDLDPGVILYWKGKLKRFTDQEVCEALVAGRWKLFPSVDNVVELIEGAREALYEQRKQDEWPAWKAAQAQAAREGKLATQAQYDELREKFRQAGFRPQVVKGEGPRKCRRTKKS
jgi:hypothetical protein